MEDHEILKNLEYLLKAAITGEHFASDPYNQSRYKEIQDHARKLYTAIPYFRSVYLEPVDETGYITPKVGVNAVIENEEGALLLEKRADDKCWGIPGGWSEVGYTAEENIQREIYEETGLKVEVKQLLQVFSRTPSKNYLHSSCHILFHCVVTEGIPCKSHESEEIAWKKVSDIDRWHFDHKEWILKLKDNDYVKNNLRFLKNL